MSRNRAEVEAWTAAAALALLFIVSAWAVLAWPPLALYAAVVGVFVLIFRSVFRDTDSE